MVAAAVLQPAGTGPIATSAATTLTLAPVADAWVDSSAPNANFGTHNRLKVRTATKRFESFLRFSVTGVGPVSDARLRLFVADGSADGGTLYQSTDPWTESGVTWSNRPAPGPLITSIGGAAPKTWIELDLTSVISGDGTYDFVIAGGVADGVAYHSRDSTAARRPQLIITASADQPPINLAPPTISAAGAERSVHFALPGSWAGDPPIAYAYQWLRCDPACQPIADATTDRYQLATQDVGARLAVTVTASNGSGSMTAQSALSDPIPEPAVPGTGDPVIAVAGDIACDPDDGEFNGGEGTATACRQKATSDLLVGQGLAGVLIPGDVQYGVGDYADFLRSYDLSWGRVNGITRPVPGNHEYGTAGADGYFRYFGERAGTPGEGWHSFDIGSWHIIGLNSNCRVVACGPGSAQETWLRQDLAASTADCTLAFWHHPRFSSGLHGSDGSVAPLWQALYEYGADVVVNGHDHDYERFAPQTPTGSLDLDHGLRQFVVGTGGNGLRPFNVLVANSEARNETDFGVLELTLGTTAYSWDFAPIAGQDYADAGTQACHGPPAGGPPPPPPPGDDFQVSAVAETAPMPHGGDSADDPAIWVHPSDPSLSTVIGTDKQPGGGLAVYDLAGTELYYYGGVAMNNVDVLDGFPLGGTDVSLVVATDKDHAALAVFRVDPETRGLVNVASRLITNASGGGLCGYHSAISGEFYAFTTNGSGVVKQFRMFDAGNGLVDAALVRKFDVGEATEGCVADDERGHFYISEELLGIWRYGAEPSDASPRLLVAGTGAGGHLTADVEGLALVESGADGYLVASSQGDHRFAIFRRTDYEFVGSFRIVPSASIDGAESTDGIDIAPVSLGPQFPGGAFVAQDGDNFTGALSANHNFKLVPWDTILQSAGE